MMQRFPLHYLPFFKEHTIAQGKAGQQITSI
jgi:hypothetical protein